LLSGFVASKTAFLKKCQSISIFFFNHCWTYPSVLSASNFSYVAFLLKGIRNNQPLFASYKLSIIQTAVREQTGLEHTSKEMAANVQTELSELNTKCGELSTAADQQGDVWHREITAIVNKRTSQVEERKTKHREILQKQSDEISHKLDEIQQAIQEIKNFLDSNDIFLA
jgi:hypothetical protein